MTGSAIAIDAGTLVDIFALAIGISGGVLGYFLLSRPGKRREERLERSQAYFQLELASIEVFKYKAEIWDVMAWAETGTCPTGRSRAECIEFADAFFYQCLNLFEVASRFRKAEVIEAEIYASWVAWFYETLEFPFFRSRWVSDYRDNYTSETRAIFDGGAALDWEGLDDNSLRRSFFALVGDVTDCNDIRRWRVAVPEAVPGPGRKAPQAVPSAPSPESFRFAWDTGAAAAEAARFAARVMGAQDSYISHGEIQLGMTNPAGNAWIEDLEARYAADFADPGPREMLIARGKGGAIVAIGILHFSLDGDPPFATIEDMAVEPALRGAGLGTQLLAQLVDRARETGARWVFLESGLGNEAAHRFFEREGFSTTSHVFARRLD